ncbi:hypothetical protein CCACVL1_26720 [Corchorus capsularis]|uniref:Uncharacterized protein n=1 Tax=Corchorus capsularis TaxID=210143 RepID=A0A1R3GDM1_COCAP|nr:hypothetical protein CCACVL1_26720 [Corchorus capsularis]
MAAGGISIWDTDIDFRMLGTVSTYNVV